MQREDVEALRDKFFVSRWLKLNLSEEDYAKARKLSVSLLKELYTEVYEMGPNAALIKKRGDALRILLNDFLAGKYEEGVLINFIEQLYVSYWPDFFNQNTTQGISTRARNEGRGLLTQTPFEDHINTSSSLRRHPFWNSKVCQDATAKADVIPKWDAWFNLLSVSSRSVQHDIIVELSMKSAHAAKVLEADEAFWNLVYSLNAD